LRKAYIFRVNQSSPFLHFYKYYSYGLYAKYFMSPSNAVELKLPLVRSILSTIKLMYLCVNCSFIQSLFIHKQVLILVNYNILQKL